MKWQFFTDVISFCIGMIVNTFSFLINKSHKFRRDIKTFGKQFPTRCYGNNLFGPREGRKLAFRQVLPTLLPW